MSPDPVRPPGARVDSVPTLKTRWWARHVDDDGSEHGHLVVLWGRLLAVAFALCLGLYLLLATSLWAYYSAYRRIPDVRWLDVAVLPRFGRVQSQIGAYYFANARTLWEKKDFVQAIFTARAAVAKAPQNLDARLFLADCWLKAGRYNECVRTLRDGIGFSGDDPRLQQALIDTCAASGRYAELLKLLREDLPARGVHLLDGHNPKYQLAEIRAVLETSDAAGAAGVVARYPQLVENPSAAPLLSQIDWEMGNREGAFTRLQKARAVQPENPDIQSAYIDMAVKLGNADEGRMAAGLFLAASPNLLAAQLRFLQAHASRQGEDKGLWMKVCTGLLLQFRNEPTAYVQLANLAAEEGWTDLSYLLYEDSLEERLNGFPFAVYYVGSLIKAHRFAEADAAWHDLSIRNSSQLAATPNIAAMVAAGAGHDSEASQIIEQLRRDTASEPRRQRSLETTFREFGLPALADGMEAKSQ